MRPSRSVLLFLVVLAAGCSSGGLKSQVQGKWEPQEEHLKGKGVVMEITGGEIKTSGPGGSLASPYRVTGGDTIETETELLGKKFTHQYKVVINGDDMTWTDEKGNTKKLKRIK
jgi:hypothetical protein